MKKLSEPPGVVLYVDDLMPILTKCSLEEVGRFTLAALEYRRHGVLPNFDDSPILCIAWDLSKLKFDRDRIKHIEQQLRGIYGVYKRDFKKGEPPTFERWLKEIYVPMMGAHDPLVDAYVTETISESVTEIVQETEAVPQKLSLSQTVAGEEEVAGLSRGWRRGTDMTHEEMSRLIAKYEPT